METINTKAEELKIQFFELINNSQLPISLVYYLFKDIMQELTDFYNKILQEEFDRAKEEEEKHENINVSAKSHVEETKEE